MRYDDVRWGIEPCEIEGCHNDAELVIEPWGWAVCIECTEKIIERRVIAEQYGQEALRNLPPLGEWYEAQCVVVLKEEFDDA